MIEAAFTPYGTKRFLFLCFLRPQDKASAGRDIVPVRWEVAHAEWICGYDVGDRHYVTRAKAARAAHTFTCCGYTGTHSRYCGDE
jgi:hypothetical protein